MTLETKTQEANLFLAELRRQYEVPATYLIDMTVIPAKQSTDSSNKPVGTCWADRSSARIVVAGDRSLYAILLTVAHEYKHVLQGVEGCKLKAGGKACEKQASDFATNNFFPYADARVKQDVSDEVRDALELACFLYNVAGIGRAA